MDRSKNRFLVALGSLAAILLLLGSFLVVWLLPKGPETSTAEVQTPAIGSAPSKATVDEQVSQYAGTAKGGTLSQVGGPTMAGVTDQAHISVRGTGSVSVKPDMATIQVGVQIQNTLLSAAQTEAASKMDAIIKQLKDAGVAEKDIATTQFSVEPVMNYKENQPPTVTGYRVTNVVSVKLHDITKAGTMIDSLVGSGANTLYGISFGFSDPTASMNQAREQAMKDAKAKAEQLAKLAGVSLGGAIVIEDGGSNVPPPVLDTMSAGAAEKSMGGATPVNPGQQEVRADVNVTYAIK